jgi:membrane fusion protein YbhG
MRMNRGVLAFGVTAAALFVAAGCRNRQSAGGPIRISGNIETTETVVSFKIPGRIAARPVDEGEAVRAGQLMARLDSRDLEQEAGQRQAAVEAARSALAELLAGSRPEDIGAARARVEQARADFERLQKDDVRNRDLLNKDVISQREFDATHGAFLAGQARLQQTEQEYQRVHQGPRREDIDQARARLQEQREALALARTRLSYAEVFSPLTGVVLSKNAEPGEVVAAGTPVVTVADLSHVYLRAYVEEGDLGRVRIGQKASVTTDSYPGKLYTGRVAFISSEAEFTPKSVQTRNERVKLVYRVKIDLGNPHQELKPGMPADAEIFTAKDAD